MCLLNGGLDYSRSDLVFERSRLRNNFIFGILYCLIFRLSLFFIVLLMASACCSVSTKRFLGMTKMPLPTNQKTAGSKLDRTS